MNPRLGGALLALAAVALFVVSLATSAWWNGHPSVDGKVREIQEVHVGLHGGEGCNTRGCSALEISTPAKILGFGELGIVGFAAIIGAALGLASYRGSDRRQPVGKLALGVIGLALLVSIVLVALGPVSAQKVSLPIGWGLIMFWAGSGALVVASALAMRTRQPFQLKPSRPKLPSQPSAIPASAPYVAPLPPMQPASSFPPPAPMFPPPPAHPARNFPPPGPVFPPPTPYASPMPAPFISPYQEPAPQNPLAPIVPPRPLPPSPGGALACPAGLIMPGAPPDLPPSEAMTVPLQKASSPSLPPPNRGAGPPPPPRPSSPRPTIAGPAVAPERSATDADVAAEQFSDDGTSPTIEPPPPLDATAPADDPTIPPPDAIEPGSISADATMQVDRVSAPQLPATAPPPPSPPPPAAPQTMPMPSVPMPSVPMPGRPGKPSVPPPNIPGFTGIPNIPLARPANPALAAAMAAPMGPPLQAAKPAEPALPPIAPPPAEPPKRASTPAVPI